MAGDRDAALQWFSSCVGHARTRIKPDSTSGIGAQAGYEYSTRRVNLVGFAEHYDRGFEMETAFINRVGITSGWGYAELNFYPAKDKYPWVHRIAPFSFTQGGRDRNAGGNELLQVTGVRMNFTRQGFIRLDNFEGFEIWAGQQFDRGNWRAQGNVQLYRWLFLEGQYMFGLGVFYDPDVPFQGRAEGFERWASRCSRVDGSHRLCLTDTSRSIVRPQANAFTTWTSSTAGRRISSRVSSSSGPSRSTTARATRS